MAKMWAGRAAGQLDQTADDFNSSIHFDSRMYRQDITGSLAHAAMLAKQGILTEEEAAQLAEGLADILADIESGKLPIDPAAEDIHMFVEQVLTERLGDVGKKLHTARSRNDQVALDLRLWLREERAARSKRRSGRSSASSPTKRRPTRTPSSPATPTCSGPSPSSSPSSSWPTA